MGHLEKFRIGWQNEHLATFLLSRISFVASPVKVADDVGTDLFCTLFEIGGGELYPRSSFAIQLKSKSQRSQVIVTNKIEYFEKLELPFFAGIVDQSKLRLSIYSGEYVPILFSHYGRPKKLTLLLEDGDVTFTNYCEHKGNEGYFLRMPHVVDLDVGENRESSGNKGRQLLQLCSRMHQNISAKVICEYVFRLGDGRPVIFAGPGSAATFRDNFYSRLAEVFCNLERLHRVDPGSTNRSETETYRQCYLELKKAVQVPLELEAAYLKFKQSWNHEAD